MKRPALLCDVRICGRGRHLLRCAVHEGQVTVTSGADVAAFAPVLSRGYAQRIEGDRYEATDQGRKFLMALVRAE